MCASSAVSLTPSARRVIHSLRGLGYEFAPAIADLIDNSIVAGASKIDVQIRFAGAASWVRIADNGSGMSHETLVEAMRYGSQREYDEIDLGKFGLGLKTASLSQCRTLTVSSKPGAKGRIASYAWNLDHIEASDRWEILRVARDELPASIQEFLDGDYQTIITWEKLDRVLEYNNPEGEHARRHLLELTRETEEHLAMVFHRFLSGQARRKRVSIRVNGNEVQAWDPYCRSEKNTRAFPAECIPIEVNGKESQVYFEPFVLPHEKRFSSPKAHSAAAGPEKWNRQQGFYLYRSDRLIQCGGWQGIRTIDEHLKLARIALRFDPALDEAFKVNVAKMTVRLPAVLRDELIRKLNPVSNAAKNEYARGAKLAREAATTHENPPSPNGGASTEGTAPSSRADVNGSSNTPLRTGTMPATSGPMSPNSTPTPTAAPYAPLYTYDEFFEKALTVCETHEEPVVRNVFERLKNR